MATRSYKRLTVARVRELAKVPGMHPDGDGLYLTVTPSRVASWAFRYMLGRREHSMGLGPLRHVGLAEARHLADDARRLKRDGIDPLERRRAQRQDEALAVAKAMPFQQCAEAYVTSHRAGWKGAAQAAQWRQSMAAYVYPVFGGVSVQAVDVSLVMRALEPIWNDKAETASRVRGRIESILDWATARGHRHGDNPARWRGHLENLLPARRRMRQVKHYAALPHAEIGAFMAELREQEGVAARALEFAILTAARSGEVLGARWGEINLRERAWTIPAERTKAGKEHRVPLSAAALVVIEQAAAVRSGDHVFPGAGSGGALGKVALAEVLRRLERACTVHGFRATFRSWAAERLVPDPIAEMALGHTISAAVVRAYQRSDLFEQRRRLLDAWAQSCASEPGAGGEVVQLVTGR